MPRPIHKLIIAVGTIAIVAIVAISTIERDHTTPEHPADQRDEVVQNAENEPVAIDEPFAEEIYMVNVGVMERTELQDGELQFLFRRSGDPDNVVRMLRLGSQDVSSDNGTVPRDGNCFVHYQVKRTVGEDRGSATVHNRVRDLGSTPLSGCSDLAYNSLVSTYYGSSP